MSALPMDYPLAPARGAVVLQFPTARVRRPAPAPLRITRRGRLVVTLGMTALLAAVGLVGASQAVAGQEASSVPVEQVTVVPGDTLWSIAAAVAEPGSDVRDVVAEIAELNALPTSQVFAGQHLVVPAVD